MAHISRRLLQVERAIRADLQRYEALASRPPGALDELEIGLEPGVLKELILGRRNMLSRLALEERDPEQGNGGGGTLSSRGVEALRLHTTASQITRPGVGSNRPSRA